MMTDLTDSVIANLKEIDTKLGRLMHRSPAHDLQQEYEVCRALLTNVSELLRMVGADSNDAHDIAQLGVALDKVLDGSWKAKDFVQAVERLASGRKGNDDENRAAAGG